MLGDPAVGGEALTTGYAQMALAAEGHPLDTVTATMTPLAARPADAGWPLAGQRPQPAAVRIQHDQPHRDRRRRVEIRIRSPVARARSPRACDERGEWLLAAAAEIGGRTGDAPDGSGVDRRTAVARDRRHQGDSRSTGSRRRLVPVRPHRRGRLRDGTLALRAARRRRAADRRRVPQGRRVPARDPVSGRRLAREDALVSRSSGISKAGFRSAGINGSPRRARAGRHWRSRRRCPTRIRRRAWCQRAADGHESAGAASQTRVASVCRSAVLAVGPAHWRKLDQVAPTV